MPAKKLLKRGGASGRSKKPVTEGRGVHLWRLRMHHWSPLAHAEPYSNRFTYDELVGMESEIGRTLFGPIPVGHQREFFLHRKNVWVWHESFIDAAGVAQEMTVRYEVRPEGVYKKASSGGLWERLEGDELENFVRAAQAYYKLVKEKLYD